MNTTMRKETPDSEAVASSEDERPWPSAPSFGTLPRKENGMSGISGGIWSTQKRGSFKLDKNPQRAVARDPRFGAINPSRSTLRSDGTPSPSASDGSGALPFAIPLQPTPKTGRSLSHSQGQREGSRSNEQNMVLSLGLLAEEVDTETDSELGGALTHTTSHPPIGTLQRTSTFPPTFESLYGLGHSKGSFKTSGNTRSSPSADRKFEAAFANMSLDPSQRRTHWQTHLGWDDVPNVNESRRHSMAEIPTRRGSLVGVDGRPSQAGGFWPDGIMYNWEEAIDSEQSYRDSQSRLSYSSMGQEHSDIRKGADKPGRTQEARYHEHDIPSMYRAPNVSIAAHERSEQERRGQAGLGGWAGGNAGAGPSGRPRKQLFIVSFKCSRVEVFYLLENTGLSIKEGDIVIVEADRGQDLGTVQHANVTPDEARVYKRKYGEEQYKWLMMFSKNNVHSNVNPNAQQYSNNLVTNAPNTMQGPPRGDILNLKPKAIKRLANVHEIRMLSEKEGNEAKAKRACQQKVAHLHLDMEILDAEWQWDFQKLIFYYYADHYINFKDLITELYRIYKTRIWLSAINPASFSQHAAGQPPSGIGPGAVAGLNQQMGNSYTMMYGADPDPYGAVPPYRIGYETYTPNYPAIPGVANSFAPSAPPSIGPATFGQFPSTSGDVTPAAPPPPPGRQGNMGYYYDRGGSQEQTPKPFQATATYSGGASTTTNDFYNPLFFSPTMASTSATSSDRPTFGMAYPPGMMMDNMMPNMGRTANAPAPIGTRPPSMGSKTIAGTSSSAAFDPQRRMWASSRPPADFIPAQQQQGHCMTSTISPFSPTAPMAAKNDAMKAFIDGLGGQEKLEEGKMRDGSR